MSAGPLWFGEFRDRYVRENGEWKFLERRGAIQMKFGGPYACSMNSIFFGAQAETERVVDSRVHKRSIPDSQLRIIMMGTRANHC